MRTFIGFLLLQCAFVSPTNATTLRSYSPTPGSAERKAICNAMRHYVLKDVMTALPKPILFHVKRMVVADRFCSFEGYPVFNDGSSVGTEFLSGVVYKTGLEKQDAYWIVVYDLTKTDVRNSAELAEIRKSFPPRFPHEILPDFWRDRLLIESTTTPRSEEEGVEQLKQRSAQLDPRAVELDRRTAELDRRTQQGQPSAPRESYETRRPQAATASVAPASEPTTTPVGPTPSQSTGTQADREPTAQEFSEAFHAAPDAFNTDQFEKDKVYRITGKFAQYFTIMQIMDDGTIGIGDARMANPELIAILVPQNPEMLETANIPKTSARATGIFIQFVEIELTKGAFKHLPAFVISGLSLSSGRYIDMRKK